MYKQISSVMRLTTIFILLTACQLYAASSFGQRFTLVRNKVPVSLLFKEIKKQTGYHVLWDDAVLKGSTEIRANFSNTLINEVMETSLNDLPVTFTIENKSIILKPRKPSFLDRIVDLFTVIDVRGIVLDEQGNPLAGATVRVRGNNKSVATNEKGEFYLKGVEEGAILMVSYLGYVGQEIGAVAELGKIRLSLLNDELREVEILSTGYQELPKERATGSFTLVDQKTINRGVGVNILDRLEGVTSGLLLNRGLPTGSQGNNPKIAVHGRSTIFANAEPLIVLNGFAYDGTIDQINPADIENINVLKDAAAASIWGSRSGNGVIVITTKMGRKNQALKLNASSVMTVSDKPDLYYQPQISSSDFIDLEQFLFNKGFYNSRFSNAYNIVSPAVEIFNQRKNKLISSADSASQINALKGYDVRKDLEKYLYRNKIYQQHQLNLSGGTEHLLYYISGGFDKNLESQITDSYDRLSISNNNTYSTLKDKLKINTEIALVTSNDRSTAISSAYSPYERMADESGSAVALLRDYRKSYVDTAGAGKLLDWHYYPKNELQPVTLRKLFQYRVKAGLSFEILKGLSLNATYQVLNEQTKGETNNTLENYSTRDRINRLSSISNGTVNYVIPIGDIHSITNNILNSKAFRTQVNFNKTLFSDHELNFIAGFEANDTRKNTQYQLYYGFDPETQSHVNGTINPLASYKLYYSEGTQKVNTDGSLSQSININQSYYANGAYTYHRKYTLSGSLRRDESNIFGVETNQKGVPLWSSGLAWNVAEEAFYKITWLPVLKARLSYGYNGNVDNSVSAYLTANATPSLNLNGNNASAIVNPPNPDLRWEKVKTWNFGLDFSSKNSRLSGSLDWYRKNAIDLIGNNMIAFQSGLSQYKGNGANLQTKGLDLVLNSKNLIHTLAWNTTLLFNYNTDKVTKYTVKQSSNFNIVNNNFQNPLVGYPYNSIFSFPSAGLDATGAIQGYLNGVVSKDYSKITSTLDPNQLIFHGSAAPKYFGSFINTFNYKGLGLSFNIVYKFDYYFRRSNVFSGSNYGSSALVTYILADYDKRWKNPGDELLTRIPALTYPAVAVRNTFFNFTEDLVERADHIRLQDIRLAYSLTGIPVFNKLFRRAEVFAYARNLGILWKKNKVNIDPDVRSGTPTQLSGSLGLNLTL